MAVEQDNGAIVRRFLDLVWNRGELSAIEDNAPPPHWDRPPAAHARSAWLG
jgi:hypothetical protein